MSKFKDITGFRFGRFLVVGYSHSVNGACWKCLCKCGATRIIKGSTLRTGYRKSCGCLVVNGTATHRMSHTRLYRTYIGMKDRCYRENSKDYKYYGGRGIKICRGWRRVDAFLKWAVASGYKDGLSIERIDPNGDYSPSNCTWVPMSDQGKNRRCVHRYQYQGELLTLSTISRRFGVNVETLRSRLKRGLSVHVAVTTPVSTK